MIIGIIPIGGKGSRLGLPFSKEMLPQKDYGFYNPIANHLVEKMKFAGATKIIFVHGEHLKSDVESYFNEPNFHFHINQKSLGFAQVLKDSYEHISIKDNDQILFGMPDSVFEGNPFIEMLTFDGICAGLFTTLATSKVDRLVNNEKKFEIKSMKNSNNSKYFWGVVKFQGINIRKFIDDNFFEKSKEIGEILNIYSFNQVLAGKYIDIGTWENYNKYMSRKNLYPNTEIEKKYIVNELEEAFFINKFKNLGDFNYEYIESTDFYFQNDNKNIEFIRYREKSKNSLLPPDITVKNIHPNPLNRYELEIPLSDNIKTESVLSLLKLIGLNFKFKVFKKCHIYTSNDISIVLYSFPLLEKTIKIIEIELFTADFDLFDFYENLLISIPGFNCNNVVNSSKFKLITEALSDTSH